MTRKNDEPPSIVRLVPAKPLKQRPAPRPN